MIANRLSPPKDIWRWPKSTASVLGGLLALLFGTASILSSRYTPPPMPYFTTHVGIYRMDSVMIAALFMSMTLVYTVVFVWLRTVRLTTRQFRQAIVWAIIFSTALMMSTPLMSVDLYGYIFRAEIVNVHHVNPYHSAPAELGYGDIVPYADGVMPYGPLYTSYSLALQKAFGKNFATNVAGFRVVNLLLLAACAWIFFRIAKLLIPRWARASLVLFIWNPFILVELINNGHNDVLVLLSVLGSLWLLITKRPVWAGLALVAGALVKFVTIALLPIVVLWILWRRTSISRTLWQIGGLLVAAVILIVLFYLPYHSFAENIGNVGSAFVSKFKPTFPVAMTRAALQPLQSVIGQTLSLSFVIPYFSATLFFLLSSYVLFVRRMRGKRSALPQQYFWILFLALSFVPIVFNVWYMVWCMPLLLLFTQRSSSAMIIFFTLSGFVFYVDRFFLANILLWLLLGLYYSYQWVAPRFHRTHRHTISSMS